MSNTRGGSGSCWWQRETWKKTWIWCFQSRQRQTLQNSGKDNVLKGCWCNMCRWVSCILKHIHNNLPCSRDNPEVFAVGLWKCFLTGSNSTLHQHCWKHYKLYKQKCEGANIPINHHAIPPSIQKLVRAESEVLQTNLDNMFGKCPVDRYTAVLNWLNVF